MVSESFPIQILARLPVILRFLLIFHDPLGNSQGRAFRYATANSFDSLPTPYYHLWN